MDTRNLRRFMWIFLVTLSGSINLEFSEAKEMPRCQASLHAAVRQPFFIDVGLELMKINEDHGKGFVFSPMKMLHKLTTLFALGSSLAEYGIMTYLGLSNECDGITLCKSFDMIVNDMNSHLTSEVFLFSSWVYYQSNYEEEGLDFCASPHEYNFHGDQETVLSGINQRYREYCETNSPYLDHSLNSNSLFFILDVLKITPKIFGTINRYESSLTFIDIDNYERKASWLRIKGEIVCGKYTELTNCEYVRTYRAEINDGKVYMLIFQPMPDEYVRHEQITCIKEILSKLGDYIKFTIETLSRPGRGWSKADSLVFPLLDMSTDVDLKPILEKNANLKQLFQQHQIPGINNGVLGVTLQELREWDYFNTKPENYDQLIPESNLLDSAFLIRPFVFAFVEKNTGMVLKTGTVLRI